MSTDDAVETIEQGNFVGKLYHMSDPLNPRKEYDQNATMFCAHRRYLLGDVQVKGESDVVQEILSHFDIKPICHGCKQPVYMNGYRDEWYHDDEESECELDDPHPDLAEIELMPLFLYDHSGITMSTSRFSDPWDSGQVGVIAISHAKIKEIFMTNEITEEVLEKAKKLMEAEVAEYDAYLTGDVYGYVIEDKQGEEVESTWGYYGHKYALETLEESLKYRTLVKG